MTELERWINKYGKAPAAKTNNAAAHASADKNKVKNKEERDINAIIKARLDKTPLFRETPEEKLQRKMRKTHPDYHPGVHTKSMNLPIFRTQQYLDAKIHDIISSGGEILDIQQASTSMYGMQTMFVTIIYEMPDWEHIVSY